MSRIVFAWELGTNFGHISRFVPFIRELKERGHDVMLAVRELHHVQRIMNKKDIPIVQAPLWLPTVQGLPEPPLNYAEILLRFGYHDVRGLAGVVGAWRALLMLYRADMLIVSHAPTALLAARSMDIPAATLGAGFFLPPAVAPTPNMRYWTDIPNARLESSDAIVLKTINTILNSCGKPALNNLAALFDLKEQFLCTEPEIDHYPQRTGTKYWGGVNNAEMGQVHNWPDAEGKRVFIYMDLHHRDFVAVMEAVKALELSALVCVPGISDNMREQFSSDRVVISPSPIRFSGLLAQCDLAICHAGHGTVTSMLRAGVPLLLLPNHLEQFLLADRVRNIGAGELVNLDVFAPDYAELLKSMLDNPDYRTKAQQFAERYADRTLASQVSEIVTRIEELVAE